MHVLVFIRGLDSTVLLNSNSTECARLSTAVRHAAAALADELDVLVAEVSLGDVADQARGVVDRLGDAELVTSWYNTTTTLLGLTDASDSYDSNALQRLALILDHGNEVRLMRHFLAKKRDGEPHCEVHLFRRLPADRACLLNDWRRKTKHEVVDLGGLHPLQVPHRLLARVNAALGKHRQLDGSLNRDGRLIQQLEEGLYSVEPRQDVPLANGSPLPVVQECPRISMPDRETFLREYVAKGRPVIITDAVDDWPALAKWNDEYMLQHHAKAPVHIKIAPRGVFEGTEPLDAWGTAEQRDRDVPPLVQERLSVRDRVVVRPADSTLAFHDFIDALDSNNASFYLEYAPIDSYIPELLHDVGTLPFADFFEPGLPTNMWLGNGETVGKLHFDAYDNVLVQLIGSKSFIVFEPTDNERLYEGHIREAKLSYDAKAGSFSRHELMDSTAMVMSPVDIASVDLDEFPRFEQAARRALNCTVQRSEVLFLPAFWWHEVQSSPSPDGRNYAINTWYAPFFTRAFPCARCRRSFNQAQYSHLLENLRTTHDNS